MEMLREPKGTRVAPGRTCADLAIANPKMKDGVYWIDPNGGSIKDAIEVYCYIKQHKTCVVPKPEMYSKGRWFDQPSENLSWFSGDARGGNEFTYKIDRSQLTFLQLLSSEASQTITYHCKNSAAYFDASSHSFNNAAVFETNNDMRLSATGQLKQRYTVLSDDCQYKKNSWASTVFEFKTTKTVRLPITDVGLKDVGDDQEFGLEIGNVCFS